MDALAVLQRLGTHRFIDELGTTLAAVSDEVALTRKKGKVTVTFTLSPGPGNDLAVQVAEEIKRTPPVKAPRGAIFFVLDGELHDGDPRQPQMDFREVDRPASRLVDVDGNGTVINVRDTG